MQIAWSLGNAIMKIKWSLDNAIMHYQVITCNNAIMQSNGSSQLNNNALVASTLILQ